MGRPKKVLDEIEKEMQSSDIQVLETAKEKPIDYPKPKKEKSLSLDANIIEEGYTLEVIADHGPKDDIFRIPSPNPNFEYRYLRFKDEANMSKKTSNLLTRYGGWQICPKEHVLKLGFPENLLASDGSRRVGEHILAYMPKSYYEKKLAAKEDTAINRMVDVYRKNREGDQSVGGREMHPTMKGIQPGKSDGGRVVLGVRETE